MPNVIEMEKRLASHMARVNGKMIEREFDRILNLQADRKISHETAASLRQSAALRLAYIANVR